MIDLGKLYHEHQRMNPDADKNERRMKPDVPKEQWGMNRKTAEKSTHQVAELDTTQLATKADLYRMAVIIVLANVSLTAVVIFGLLKLLSP